MDTVSFDACQQDVNARLDIATQFLAGVPYSLRFAEPCVRAALSEDQPALEAIRGPQTPHTPAYLGPSSVALTTVLS
jgi:hypothetical protein